VVAVECLRIGDRLGVECMCIKMMSVVEVVAEYYCSGGGIVIVIVLYWVEPTCPSYIFQTRITFVTRKRTNHYPLKPTRVRRFVRDSFVLQEGCPSSLDHGTPKHLTF